MLKKFDKFQRLICMSENKFYTLKKLFYGKKTNFCF